MTAPFRALQEDEFKATFSPPMRDISAGAEEIVDLWAYADPVLAAAFPAAAGWEWRVKHIYAAANGAFQHVLIPVPVDDTYLVVVIDTARRGIVGHRLLDLGALYGDGSDEAAGPGRE